MALKELGRLGEALAAFDAALKLDPQSAHARNNKGAVQLLSEQFGEGWESYEFRWLTNLTPKNKIELPIPEWKGGSIKGAKIVVFDEQGLGDTLQFSRYLLLLVEAGANVTFCCRRKMHRLLGQLSQPVQLIDAIEDAHGFDYQIALSSLPRAFGTRLGTIPAHVPYLGAEAGLVAAWGERIGGIGFKIGICWHGNPDIKADPNRSVSLRSFAPLGAIDGTRLISLQKWDGLDQLGQMPEGMKVECLGDDLDAGSDAFIDSAAVMQNLDLIVTCDTSIAHLAGALGRPVWVLLKKVPDWRWLLDRDDSPWYPTMRLFRQNERRNWQEVGDRVALAVKSMLNGAPRSVA